MLAALLCWITSPAPSAAGPALLYDAATRQVLYAEDVDHPWFAASLTKLMTAYIVLETWKAGKAAPGDVIVVSARANSRPKMRLGLGAGKRLTYEEAMAALIIHSANDIAVAIAEAIAGSEEAFVEQMNATALRLGMTSTRFINPNGLPGEGQHTTARDMARLTHAIMHDFPEHSGLFALKTAPVGKRTVSTHNPVLVRMEGGDGMKTGFTCSAGYNIVASATREGVRLVAIVLGEATPVQREMRTASLIEHGFRMLEWKAIFEPTTLGDLPVEPFDLEQARAANLAKRFKDCQAPEAEYDDDGNPICPTLDQVKFVRSGRAVRIVLAMRSGKLGRGLPDVCAQQIMAKAKQGVRKPVQVAAKRGGARPVAAVRPAKAQGDGGRAFGNAVP